MKLLLSGFRDNRHSKFGGYDWIRFYPEADYFSDKDVPFGFLKVGQKGKSFNLRLLEKFTNIKASKYDIVHFFYGDLTLYHPLSKKRRFKAIATIHNNTEKIEKHHENIIECIKSLDAIIVLNSNQATYLREKCNINAYFIPHGFDRPQFNFMPAKEIIDFDESKVNVIVTGRQYRDYETLEYAIQNSSEMGIQFYLIGLKEEQKRRFQHYKNATVCPRLNDDAYYSLISSCDYCFLPLTFATANNALMEAQHLGVRCVLPKISGVTDYANPFDNIFYNDKTELLEILSKLEKQTISVILKSHAEKFLWKNIYSQLGDFYRSLLELK